MMSAAAAIKHMVMIIIIPAAPNGRRDMKFHIPLVSFAPTEGVDASIALDIIFG
jgi:hypothetical protein